MQPAQLYYLFKSNQMEWWLWLIIVGSILVVSVVLYLLLAGDDEEEQQMEEKMERGDKHRTIDLNDPEVLKALRTDGLVVHVGRPTHLMVADDGADGYSWIMNESCDGIVMIEILDGPPMRMDKSDKPPPPPEEKRLR